MEPQPSRANTSQFRPRLRRSAVACGLLLMLIGCGGPTPVCAPGRSVPCACVDGRSGAQTCSSTGVYSECRCASGVGDAGQDSGSLLLTDATGQDSGGFVDSATPAVDSFVRDIAEMDTLPLDSGGSFPLDVVVATDVQRTDIQAPPDTGSSSCSRLPSTTLVPTQMTDSPLGRVGFYGTAIGFSAGGLFASLSLGSSFSNAMVYNSQGFSRPFPAGSNSGTPLEPIIRFVGEDLVITPNNGRLLVANESRGIASLDSPFGAAVDREQGVFYSSVGRLFRWTAGTVGPGTLVTTGVDAPASMVLNSDASALYYLSTGSTRGIFYVALSRGLDGFVTGSTPSLYLASSVLGTPTGLAIDICGNLYTTDTRGRILWRIPAGPSPSQPGTRLVVLASGNVGRPEFGSGIWGSSNIFMPTMGFFVPAGVEGVRQ